MHPSGQGAYSMAGGGARLPPALSNAITATAATDVSRVRSWDVLAIACRFGRLDGRGRLRLVHSQSSLSLTQPVWSAVLSRVRGSWMPGFCPCQGGKRLYSVGGLATHVQPGNDCAGGRRCDCPNMHASAVADVLQPQQQNFQKSSTNDDCTVLLRSSAKKY
jgi:hypothetical protein